MTIRLVLADDHPLILRGLESLLTREAGFEIAASCADGEEALRAVREHDPDILVLDIRMPGMDGISVIREIQALGLRTKTVVLTGELGEQDAVEIIRLGVKGIILKDMAPHLLIQCLQRVNSGGWWLERHSFGKTLDTLLLREEGIEKMNRYLTTREIELVRMVGEGLRNRQIAERLSISEDTVKRHLYNIYQKLHVESRAQLMRFVHEKRLL